MAVFVVSPLAAREGTVKSGDTASNWDWCGLYSTDGSMDYWYCWKSPPDDSTAYQYDVWQRLVDTPCWTHSTGFAQAGTGPEYYNFDVYGNGPPTPLCP
jgi:hypothetical protein